MGEWNPSTWIPHRENQWDVWEVCLYQVNHREPRYLGRDGMELSWMKDRINQSSPHSPHMMKGRKRVPIVACYCHMMRIVDHILNLP